MADLQSNSVLHIVRVSALCTERGQFRRGVGRAMWGNRRKRRHFQGEEEEAHTARKEQDSCLVHQSEI